MTRLDVPAPNARAVDDHRRDATPIQASDAELPGEPASRLTSTGDDLENER